MPLIFMESSLFSCLSASPPLIDSPKTPKSHILLQNRTPICYPKLISFNLSSSTNETQTQIHKCCIVASKTRFFLKSHLLSLRPQFSFLVLGFFSPFSCLASETVMLPDEEVSNRINLESILLAVDSFFNRYPFFVATVAFMWLVVIPLTEEYLRKYKFISAINAFKKLQDDPDCQLLDIRDGKSVAVLGSPNLKFVRKSVAQVEFLEGDEDGFVKRVLEIFGNPTNTTVCIIDNFDGNSLKVAELLVKNGLKEAFAIRGGVRGQKGWQDIQETLLPPSVHIYPKKSVKKPKPSDTNGGISRITQQNRNSEVVGADNTHKEIESEDFSSISHSARSKVGQKPLSPYPNYSDFKPPSSPTPSKPK